MKFFHRRANYRVRCSCRLQYCIPNPNKPILSSHSPLDLPLTPWSLSRRAVLPAPPFPPAPARVTSSNFSSHAPPSPIVESHPRHVVVWATYRYALLSMSISLHLSPFVSPSLSLSPCPPCPGSFATPNFIDLSSRITISWSRLQYAQHPCISIPLLTACLSLTSCPPSLVLLPWFSWHLRLPFPVLLPHHSLASAFPTHVTPAPLVFSRPPSLALSPHPPTLSPCPSPPRLG